MRNGQRKNGVLEIRFNEDRTRALATIYPPVGGGEAIEVVEVLAKLKAQGVQYGIREQSILEAIHYVKDNDRPLADLVIAQGGVPQDGIDAKVRYHLPLELLTKPLPKGPFHQTDWFALDPDKLVKAGQELATIVPPQPGVPGKTLTWPVQTIAPKPGKPAGLTAGANMRLAGEGTRLLAELDGYVCLHGETMTVHSLQRIDALVTGGMHEVPHGIVFMHSATQTDIRSGSFIAIQGVARNCFLRATGDIFLRVARDCTIVASGSVYVTEGLVNCEVISPNRFYALPHTHVIGGSVCAREGVEVGNVGSEDFTGTELVVGEDRYSAVRNEEIKEELAACEANRERISQALKPFTSLSAHTQLTDEKRLLVDRMQAQKRALEERSQTLHGERRALMVSSKSRTNGSILVAQIVHPGVWLRIDGAALQVEVPMARTEFTATANGKSVATQPLSQAA